MTGRSLLLAIALLAALPVTASERILDFDVDIHLDANGRFRVEERIRYDFGTKRRRGIYRDIPVRYGRGNAADYRIELGVDSVTDEKGTARPFVVERAGRHQRIRIGDPNQRIRGEQEYRISYRVARGILWLENHDELYWNVTGHGWQVPIERTSLRLLVTTDQPVGDVRVGCFTGPRGAVEVACGARADLDGAFYAGERALAAGEGLTIVAGFEKGVLEEPSALKKFFIRASDFVSAATLLPVATLLGLGTIWWRTGRDPEGATAIPVRYEPPEGMTPGTLGTVLDERVDLRDITATVLDLAVRGFIRIEELEGDGFLFLSKSDYRFHKLPRAVEELHPHETQVLNAIFRSGETVELSDLKNRFYQRIPAIRDALYEEVSKVRGWFPRSPDAVRKRYRGLAIGIALPLFVLAMMFGRPGSAFAVALSGLIALAFARVMPRRTLAGRRARQHVLGFQEFVERVEVDRLERMGRRSIEQFERLLPFAFVLGSADAWANAFADLYTEPPDWYIARQQGPFQPGRFIDRMGHSLDTMANVMQSQPRNTGSGSGSSGFGGGGFSGGGLGGGGGGSW